MVTAFGIKIDARGHGDTNFIEHARTEILAVIRELADIDVEIERTFRHNKIIHANYGQAL